MKNNNNGEAYPLPLRRNLNNGEAYPLPLTRPTRGHQLTHVGKMALQYNRRVSALTRQANSPAARKAAINAMVKRAIVNAAKNKKKFK
jgi:hypothetical protein